MLCATVPAKQASTLIDICLEDGRKEAPCGTATSPAARSAAADRPRVRRVWPPLRTLLRPMPVHDPLEREARRRRRLRRLRSVLRGEDPSDVRDGQPPLPHVHQRPDHDPHHLVQEGVRTESEDDKVSFSPNREPLELAYRRLACAGMPAEAREVVRTDKQSGRAPHLGGVEGARPAPGVAARERVGGLRCVDHVAVFACAGREPSVEAVADLARALNRHLRREPPVEEFADLDGGPGGARQERRDLAARVHTSVGTPSDRHLHALAEQLFERGGEQSLDCSGPAIALRRPSMEVGAVVREIQPDRSRNVHAKEYVASVAPVTVWAWRSTFDPRPPATWRPSARCSVTCTTSRVTWRGRRRPGTASSATPTARSWSPRTEASSRSAPPTCW